VLAPSAAAAGSTCGSLKEAYKASSCCGDDKAKVTDYTVMPPTSEITYTYNTGVTLGPDSSIQPYTKVKSATCGYATVTGAVFSDPTILTEVPKFYSFLDSNYITDPAMNGPEACETHCLEAGDICSTFYYQYEWTNSSSMVSARSPARWLHKCQLNSAYGADCGSPFADDANDWDEYAGRVSAAGSPM